MPGKFFDARHSTRLNKEFTTMPIIATTNGPISFLETGTGRPILLLHGIQGTARTWDAVAPLLSERYRVISPNLRGRSDSHSPQNPEAYRLQNFACDLAAVVEMIAEPVLIVAWSMGVSVTLELLRKQRREQISGLVLVSGTAFAGDQARWFSSSTITEVEQEARERGRKLALVEAAHPRAVAAAWRHVQQADFRDFLPSIDYPTLVIHGADDDQCPIGHGRLLAEKIPGAQLNEWADCGHNPMAHDPQRFARAVARFAPDRDRADLA
jgi:pimeloyl-ACP methyl ester carboxylesterase